jgi:methyl-accepting chemotaxis protein
VSVQTNMLAVNGSIEAARAGEFGKGFAVVSTDIRNLARDSADNADRIKDLVKSLQDQTGAVRRDLDEIYNASAAEVEKNKAVTSALEVIGKDMTSVLDSNGQIAQASKDTVGILAEMKKAVEQISSTAAESEQAATQASAASKQQSQAAEELAAAIEEVASLADELQNAA